ncbi:phospholipid methyltransferase [Anaerolinea thermolimosa]|uniref:methyltransferase family protein n=1 Tax=Anaerolinea thermolimosa TaxID=229919 RepID=UPI000782BD96|nr:methyltransferase [Anaerolinea thermolimosa]GAP06153.1 phospholipid methyltransferase [Anaerolinea thermolimosa]
MKRWKAGDWIGAVVFALLLGVRLAQVAQGQIMAVPLACQAGLAAFLMLARRPEQGGVFWTRKLTAWLAALLPFGLQAGESTNFWLGVSLLGVGFSLWGLVSLGRSFGIAPALRGLITGGAYRLVRHPMYAGELLSYAAVTAGHFRLWNLALTGALLALFVLRIEWEEELLEESTDYAEYARQVRWRMIPGVW